MSRKLFGSRTNDLELADLRAGMRIEGSQHSNFYQVIITKTHSDYALGKTSVMGIPVLLTEEHKPFIAVN